MRADQPSIIKPELVVLRPFCYIPSHVSGVDECEVSDASQIKHTNTTSRLQARVLEYPQHKSKFHQEIHKKSPV